MIEIMYGHKVSITLGDVKCKDGKLVVEAKSEINVISKRELIEEYMITNDDILKAFYVHLLKTHHDWWMV
jgi:hypothetical protein